MDIYYSSLKALDQAAQLSEKDWSLLIERTHIKRIPKGTEDLRQYHYMWEEIRDSLPYTKGYLKIKDVVMGMEDAFRKYESEVLKMED